MYKVIKALISEAPNPIRLVKNEIVKCIETSDENGAWAPLNHLEKMGELSKLRFKA